MAANYCVATRVIKAQAFTGSVATKVKLNKVAAAAAVNILTTKKLYLIIVIGTLDWNKNIILRFDPPSSFI